MKTNTPSFHDVEQLSALLDGKLPQAEAARLQARLGSDPNLRAVMDDLAQTRRLLRGLPARRAPRNFTLTPKMAGVRPPLPRSVPTLRFATALAAFLLVFSMATNALAPRLTRSAAPAYGMGGGGGGGGVELESQLMEAPTEAPAEAETTLMAPAAPTLEPTLTAEESSRVLATPTPDMSFKAVVPGDAARAEETPNQAPAGPIPLGLQTGLLAAALLTGGLAWLLRSANDRSWREKTK